MLLAALATALYVLPTAALDTLRVGIGGNVSWTGETTRADLGSDPTGVQGEQAVYRRRQCAGQPD